jgi:hypothetical protein
MEQQLTTNCPQCNQEITALFHKTFYIIFEGDTKVARIGFITEIEHNCNA